jgi:hypothetical protein
MDSSSTMAQVRAQMRVFSSDGKQIGKVWNIFTRETETYVEVHPLSFWQGIVAGFVPQSADPGRGHLFLPASLIERVAGKRVIVALTRDAAMSCTGRPAWIPHEEVRMPGLL